MKRANGTGNIIKMPGNRRRPWAVRVSGRDQYGHVVQKFISYHERAADAQAALDEYNRKKAAGAVPAADQLYMTVGQVYEAWSAREFKKLNPSSISNHKSAWNQRISRYADRKMRSMTLDEWQAILDEDEAGGKSQSLINNDCILIKALYRYSMERDIVAKDYSRYLDVPSVDLKKKRDALNDEQFAKLGQLASEGFPYADTALMLCYTGFRVMEFLGLTKECYSPDNGGYLQNGLKTDAGRNRIVPIHPRIISYLAKWMDKGGETIVCYDDGRPIVYTQYADKFHAVMEAIGAPDATPHWCRHTFATRLHAAKADPLVVKWLMGHSTKSDITAHYTHKTIGQLREAILLLS